MMLPAPAEQVTWNQAWDEALDALELEADQVERMLADRSSWAVEDPKLAAPFEPPAGLGPLPLGLADRARRLLQRQLALSAELTVAMAATRQQAALAARLRRADADPRPIFVDRTD